MNIPNVYDDDGRQVVKIAPMTFWVMLYKIFGGSYPSLVKKKRNKKKQQQKKPNKIMEEFIPICGISQELPILNVTFVTRM